MKIVAASLLGLAGVMVLGFIFTAYDTGMYKFWAPKQENIRREVFTNTQSYVQGKIAYLTQLQLDYTQAQDVNQRAAIRSMILGEANQIQPELLPENLRLFIHSLEVQ